MSCGFGIRLCAYHENDIYIWCGWIHDVALPKFCCLQEVYRVLAVVRDVADVSFFRELFLEDALVYGIVYARSVN